MRLEFNPSVQPPPQIPVVDGRRAPPVPQLKLGPNLALRPPKFTMHSLPPDVIQHVASYLSHDSVASFRLASSKIYRALIPQPEPIKSGYDAFLRIRYCEKTVKLAQTLVWQQRSCPNGRSRRPPVKRLLQNNAEIVQYILELYAREPIISPPPTITNHADAAAAAAAATFSEGKLSITEQSRFSRAIYQLWVFSLLGPPLNGWPNTAWTGDVMELPAVLAVASWFQRCFDDWPDGNPRLYLPPEEREVFDIAPPGIEEVMRGCAETCFIRAAAEKDARGLGRSKSLGRFDCGRSERFVRGLSRSSSLRSEARGMQQGRNENCVKMEYLREMINLACRDGVRDTFADSWREFVVQALGEKWVRGR